MLIPWNCFNIQVDENSIKEDLSRSFVETLARRQGFGIGEYKRDHGVDISFTAPISRIKNGKKRIYYNGHNIDFQLKSTTQEDIIDSPNEIKYDLEGKNYNDLVERIDGEYAVPLFLILFILPEDRNSWVVLNSNELKIQDCAFWYRPNPDDSPFEQSKENSTKRITINKNNKLSFGFFPRIFQEAYPGLDLGFTHEAV